MIQKQTSILGAHRAVRSGRVLRQQSHRRLPQGSSGQTRAQTLFILPVNPLAQQLHALLQPGLFQVADC